MSSSLSFDRAELGQSDAPRLACTTCHEDVVQSYYTVGERVVCSRCRERAQDHGSALGRFFRAAGAGFGVAVVGALVWWGVRELTGYELAIISIGIGIGVARAILWGTRRRTTTFYRILAVVITYLGISLSYAPILAAQLAEGGPVRPVQAIAAVLFSVVMPPLIAKESFLSILIFGFGLLRAWTMSVPTGEHVVAGPFSVAPAAANV